MSQLYFEGKINCIEAQNTHEPPECNYLLCANACIASTWGLPLHYEVSKPAPK